MDSSDEERRTSKFVTERTDVEVEAPQTKKVKPGKAERLQRRQAKLALDLEALGRVPDLDPNDPKFYVLAAKALREPQIHIVKSVVQHLGADVTLGLLAKTREVQENGGVQTTNGQGVKTAGGVFFALVKEIASPDVKSLIFQSDKDAKKRAKREKRRCDQSENPEFHLSAPVLNFFPQLNQ